MMSWYKPLIYPILLPILCALHLLELWLGSEGSEQNIQGVWVNGIMEYWSWGVLGFDLDGDVLPEPRIPYPFQKKYPFLKIFLKNIGIFLQTPENFRKRDPCLRDFSSEKWTHVLKFPMKNNPFGQHILVYLQYIYLSRPLPGRLVYYCNLLERLLTDAVARYVFMLSRMMKLCMKNRNLSCETTLQHVSPG